MDFKGFSGPPLVGIGSPTRVDATPQMELGFRGTDTEGNEYVYVRGVANAASGDVVTILGTYAVVRILPEQNGPVGVLAAAIGADQYGWALRKGVATVRAATGAAAGANVFAVTAVAGQVDDGSVVGGHVLNAMFTSAEANDMATVLVAYPFIVSTIPAA